MRAFLAAILILGCGGDDPEGDPAFVDTGGTLEVPGCDYSITTRIGAEPPRAASNTVGIDPTPRLVHLGFASDPQTSIVAQWRTVDEETRVTTMRWAEGADLSAEALTEDTSGIQFGYKVLGMQIFRVHQVHLCDLKPGTSYSYQVGSEGHFSPVYTFHTAPDVAANPDSEVVIGVLGDTRNGFDVWQQVLAGVKSRSPDMVLFTGDAVTLGISQPEWEEFLGRAEPVIATVPIVMINGNHESNAVNFHSQFVAPGDQENFGFDYGHAHFTVANDTPDDVIQLTTTIVDFLRDELEATKDRRWRILAHHQPMWSASNHGPNLTLQNAWGTLVDQYGLDLVLNGHEHEFEITKPLRNKAVVGSVNEGTVYVVAGGAGAELYTSGSDFWTEYSESTFHGSVLRVRRDQLSLETFRLDGTLIPSGFTKSKP